MIDFPEYQCDDISLTFHPYSPFGLNRGKFTNNWKSLAFSFALSTFTLSPLPITYIFPPLFPLSFTARIYYNILFMRSFYLLPVISSIYPFHFLSRFSLPSLLHCNSFIKYFWVDNISCLLLPPIRDFSSLSCSPFLQETISCCLYLSSFQCYFSADT